jgi:hypothetical protein
MRWLPIAFLPPEGESQATVDLRIVKDQNLLF